MEGSHGSVTILSLWREVWRVADPPRLILPALYDGEAVVKSRKKS
jgi:hypothetical protein